MRQLPSWQRSGVVSQQRLRLRRFDSLVKREPKPRFEHVSHSYFFFVFLIILDIDMVHIMGAMDVPVLTQNMYIRVDVLKFMKEGLTNTK